MVPKTSELLPEPETPVNTVSRRFGISRLTSLRLFTRAPCTRIMSWLSAACSFVSAFVAMLYRASICPGSCPPGARRAGRWYSAVLENPEDVAVGVGDGGHQAAAADVVRGLLHDGARGGQLGQLRLDVRDVPVGHRRGHALLRARRHQPDVLAFGVVADVVGRVVLRLGAEQGGVHRLGLVQVGNGMQDGLDSLGG